MISGLGSDKRGRHRLAPTKGYAPRGVLSSHILRFPAGFACIPTGDLLHGRGTGVPIPSI